MSSTHTILLFLLLVPHIAIGLAWMFWFRNRLHLRLPKWRAALLFAGLLTGSLNLIVYWSYAIWLHRHFTVDSWRGLNGFYDISQGLILLTTAGGIFGKGPSRLSLVIAGGVGFLLWITAASGIL